MTIVHSAYKLLSDVYPDKFRAAVEQRVRQRGIDLVLGDNIDTYPEPGTAVDLTTRKGKVIKSVDLVVRHSPFSPPIHDN